MNATEQTHITSPRLITSGRGAWQGTIGELIDVDGARVEDYVIRNHNLDDQPTREELISLITRDDLRDILDDPNITVTP